MFSYYYISVIITYRDTICSYLNEVLWVVVVVADCKQTVLSRPEKTHIHRLKVHTCRTEYNLPFQLFAETRTTATAITTAKRNIIGSERDR